MLIREEYFLNKNLKTTDSRKKAKYILFAGVRPGNIVLQYLFKDKSIGEKILSVFSGEVFYDHSKFIEKREYNFSLWKKDILSGEIESLNLPRENIRYLSREIYAQRKEGNNYKIELPKKSLSMRNYIRVVENSEVFFLGFNSFRKDFVLFDSDFISKVIKKLDVVIPNACLIQLSFSKEVNNIQIESNLRGENSFFQKLFVNSDEEISQKLKFLTQNIFLSSNSEGEFSARAYYQDGSSELIQTYCSPGTRLIEFF